MTFTHKLGLLVAGVVVAMTCAVPSAFASQTVAVVDEDTGTPCGALGTADQCHIHAVGIARLEVDLVFFEILDAECNVEIEMRMNGSGGAVLDRMEHNTGPDDDCATNWTECNLPWNASGEEDASSPVGATAWAILVCIDPSESDTNCVGDVPFGLVEHPGEHHELGVLASVGLCELYMLVEFENDGLDEETIHTNHP